MILFLVEKQLFIRVNGRAHIFLKVHIGSQVGWIRMQGNRCSFTNKHEQLKLQMSLDLLLRVFFYSCVHLFDQLLQIGMIKGMMQDSARAIEHLRGVRPYFLLQNECEGRVLTPLYPKAFFIQFNGLQHNIMLLCYYFTKQN